MSTSGGDQGGRIAKKESRKPKYSRFTQQELPACKPLLTPTWVITIFAVVGIVFVPIGGVALFASRNVVEVSQSYEAACIKGVTNAQRDVMIRNTSLSKDCTVQLTVTKKMKAPIYVYYQLDNFYQNHRRYVKSRSDAQLRRDQGDKSVTSLSTCKPQAYLNGNESYPIDPCGLIAWSYFNDTYQFQKSTEPNKNISVNEKGIAWASDRDEKFGNHYPTNFNTDEATRGGGELNASEPLNSNEHLIVWMRTAALPTFRKLWGKIDEPIDAGENITVYIKNNYNTYSFNGKKKIVLSTASWLGGKNDFLGVAYLTVGCLCLFLSLVFFVVHLNNPRPLGDTTYLSWHRKSMATSS